MHHVFVRRTESDIEQRVSGHDTSFIFLIAKNLLFWGSCAAMLAVLWVVLTGIF